MTAEELFLKEGADYFGNRLIYRNKDVGIKFPGSSMSMTPEGEEIYARLSAVTDVEAKPAKHKKPSKAVSEDVGLDAGLDEVLG